MVKEYGAGNESYLYKIMYFYLAAFLEAVLLAVAMRLNPVNPNTIQNFFAIFLSFVSGFFYVTDAILAKNIYQIYNFPRLLVFTIALVSVEVYQFVNDWVSNSLVILCIILQIFEIISICFWLKDLQRNFSWFNYKTIGLSYDLQEFYKIRQSILVYYKIDFITTLNIINDPKLYIYFGTTLKPLYFSVFGISIFLFIIDFNKEVKTTRFLLISVYTFKICLGILEMVDFFFGARKITLYIPISLSYTLFNDVLLVFNLSKDMRSFGKGLMYIINKRPMKTRLDLQNERSMSDK